MEGSRVADTVFSIEFHFIFPLVLRTRCLYLAPPQRGCHRPQSFSSVTSPGLIAFALSILLFSTSPACILNVAFIPFIAPEVKVQLLQEAAAGETVLQTNSPHSGSEHLPVNRKFEVLPDPNISHSGPCGRKQAGLVEFKN